MASRQIGPLVTIVTPCLNPGNRLEACLRSVAAQTYGRVEHLVVDGGSSDATVALLESRARVRWVSEPDDGQTDAINKGFRLASGEILGWLNADDTLDPRAVELSVAALQRNPGAGWSYGDIEIHGSQTAVVRGPRALTICDLDAGDIVPQPGSLIWRWALERVGPLDSTLNLAMDFDLWVRLLTSGIPAVHVDAIVARFEIHDESKTGSAGADAFALEDFHVLARAGRWYGARAALDRWHWHSTFSTIDRHLADRRFRSASDAAASALAAMEPVLSRRRLALLIARWAPRLAAARRRRLRRGVPR